MHLRTKMPVALCWVRRCAHRLPPLWQQLPCVHSICVVFSPRREAQLPTRQGGVTTACSNPRHGVLRAVHVGEAGVQGGQADAADHTGRAHGVFVSSVQVCAH